MRYMTPDTPSTRMLDKQKRQEKEETVAKMATVTPTPTPKQSPEKAAAVDTAAAQPTQPAQPAQKRRRAIRTYGSKKRTPEDANDSRAKRPRLSLPAVLTASAGPRPSTADRTCERLIDEVSRQLQKEAAEAERRQTEANNKENLNKTPKENQRESQRENQTAAKQSPRPQTPHKTKSPRKALGIMRYFQPAAAPRPCTPPPALQAAACSPTASISSMSSLSSCPSPTPSDTSVNSVYQEDVAVAKAEDGNDDPLSPVVWREQARPKRRLTIRPEHVREDDTEANEADNESEDDADTLANTPIFKAFNGLSSSSRMRIQLGLAQPVSATTASNKAKPKTVQTTLSLAIGPSDSGSVRECKECNILYNPLHDKDAKFHARYHASVVGRGKKRV